MLPTQSNAYFRASTYCEVQTLHCRDLYVTLLSFAHLTYMVKELIDYRIALAAYLKEYKVKAQHSAKRNLTSSTHNIYDEVSTLKWLKARWRLLVTLQVGTLGIHIWKFSIFVLTIYELHIKVFYLK